MASPALPERRVIAPQPGPQTIFLSTPADIGIIGGAVFGGKSWALTCEPLRHADVAGFSAVTFRRVTPEIRNPGSLWDESKKLYPLLDADPKEQSLEWIFPSGARVKFDGLQYDADVLSWKSSQITLLQFDQLEEFTESQFWYMQSRNRSTCGVRPYTRASCNPMADTWLAALLQWWWDSESGYAIPERSGTVRWFIRVNDEIQWSDVSVTHEEAVDPNLFAQADQAARAELEARFPDRGRFARSFTFVLATLEDNAIGSALDPEYEARVRSMSYVEQERLMGSDASKGGNWKIRPAAGLVFNRAWFKIEPACPAIVAERVRCWDKAATAGGGDWTSGVRMSRTYEGVYYIEDVKRGQWASGERERMTRQAAETDPPGTRVIVEQEPGASGVDSLLATITNLAGYDARGDRPTGDKVVRANPMAAQAQVGNVRLVKGAWNESYLAELHAFPTKGIPDDQVDASSGAFNALTRSARQRSRVVSRSYVTP
jgi:predicted phage terminase large subunit-like protein